MRHKMHDLVNKSTNITSCKMAENVENKVIEN